MSPDDHASGVTPPFGKGGGAAGHTPAVPSKANVLFFDKKPASSDPWTRKLWIYDLRTNQHFTLKTNPLTRAALDDFVLSYAAGRPREERAESERWHAFTYDDLIARDKTNLDITWLRDESLEDFDHLPAPEVIAREIVEDLTAALAEFEALRRRWGREPRAPQQTEPRAASRAILTGASLSGSGEAFACGCAPRAGAGQRRRSNPTGSVSGRASATAGRLASTGTSTIAIASRIGSASGSAPIASSRCSFLASMTSGACRR